MTEFVLVQACGLFALLLLFQWLSVSFQLQLLPLLVVAGIIAGPLTSSFGPDSVFGDLFPPLVAVGTAFLLFETASRINFQEFRKLDSSGKSLSVIGTLLFFAFATIAGIAMLERSVLEACLLGALVTASGTALFAPRRNFNGPRGEIGAISRWEEVGSDVIGTTIAVFASSALALLPEAESSAAVFMTAGQILVIEVGLGLIAGLLIVPILRSNIFPDVLQRPLICLFLLGSYSFGSLLTAGGGFVSVISFAIFLANQRIADTRNLSFPRGNTRTLLVSFLVLSLTARIDKSTMELWGRDELLYVAALVLVARPAAILIATARSGLSLHERVFLSFFCRRGALLLALFPLLIPTAVAGDNEVLVSTATYASLWLVLWFNAVSPLVARFLGMIDRSPKGVLIVGAHAWARDIARELQAAGVRVLVVDTNQLNILAARREGIPSRSGNILLDRALDDIVLDNFGHLLALTSNDEVNTLAALHFAEALGRERVYQLSIGLPAKSEESESEGDEHVYGRLRNPRLFGRNITYTYIEDCVSSGCAIRSIPITRELDIMGLREDFGSQMVPLFAIKKNGEFSAFTTDRWPTVSPDQTLVCIIDASVQMDEGSSKSGRRVIQFRRG